MKIHTVCLGDSIRSVAEQYGIPESRILFDNEIVQHQRLFPGQTLVIGEPTRTDSVRGGDTLQKIAARNEIDVLTLLQCNPYLASHTPTPSQPLNIAYAQGSQNLLVHAYSGTEDDAILKKRLPLITVLSVQNVTTLQNGELHLTAHAHSLAALARRYRALPVLCVDLGGPYGQNGQNGSWELTRIFSERSQLDRFAAGITAAAKGGGFCGIEPMLPPAPDADAAQIEMLFSALAACCEREGLYLLASLYADMQTSETAERSMLKTVSFASLRSCPREDDIPAAAAPLDRVRKAIAKRQVTRFAEKLLLGIPTFGVDYTRTANGYRRRIADAAEICRGQFPFPEIAFDKKSRTPCARYSESVRHTPVLHLLHYEDARSLAAKLALVAEYGLAGISICSLTYDIPALWQLLNQTCRVAKYG